MRQFCSEAWQLFKKNHFFNSVDLFPFSTPVHLESLPTLFHIHRVDADSWSNTAANYWALLCRTLHLGSRCRPCHAVGDKRYRIIGHHII